MRRYCLSILCYFGLIMINSTLMANSVMAQKIANGPDGITIPNNIGMERYLREIVEKALSHSATFREQCQRIRQSHNLSVVIKILPYLPDGVRALSQVTRMSSGKIKIEVQLIPQLLISYVETLGHEFEHIVEQIEGIDLAALNRQPGITRSYSGKYETERAINAGHQVLQEFEESMKGVINKKRSLISQNQ